MQIFIGLALSLASSLISGFLRGNQKTETYGPRLQQLEAMDSAYGQVIPWLIGGTCKIPGQVIYAPDIVEVEHTEETGGGKGITGGGGSTSYTTYTGEATFAVSFGRGPGKIVQLYADTKLVYDNSLGAGDTVQSGITIRLYDGTSDQEVDPAIEAAVGVGNTPAYRNQIIAVFESMPLEDYGNRHPNISAIVTKTEQDNAYVIALSTLTPSASGILGIATEEIDRTTYPYIYFQEGHYSSIYDVVGEYFVKDEEYTDAMQYSYLVQDSTGVIFGQCPEIDLTPWGFAYTIKGVPLKLSRSLEPSGMPATAPTPSSITGDLWWTYPDPDHDLIYGVAETEVRSFNYDSLDRIATYTCAGVPQCAAVDIYGNLYLVEKDGSTYYLTKLAASSLSQLGQWDITTEIGSGQPKTLLYTSRYDFLVIGATNPTSRHLSRIHSWNCQAGTYAGYVEGYLYPTCMHNGAYWCVDAVDVGGSYYIQNFWRIDAHSGLAVESKNLTNTWGVSATLMPLTENYNLKYSVAGDWFVISSLSLGTYLLRGTRILAGASSLGGVVTTICNQVGATSVDVSSIPSDPLVNGYLINRKTTARSMIEVLMQAYFLDKVESDGIIHFVPRNPDPPKTIIDLTEDDLGVRGHGEDPVPLFSITPLLETELPKEVDVVYYDLDHDYEDGMQRDRRLRTVSQVIETRRFEGLAMAAWFAKDRAVLTLYIMWMERFVYQFQLSTKWIKLNPTDLVRFTIRNITHIVKITKIEYGGQGVMKITAAPDRLPRSDDPYEVPYDPYDTDIDEGDADSGEGGSGGEEDGGGGGGDGSGGGDGGGGGIPTTAGSQLYLLDVPTLQDADDGPCFYAASRPLTSQGQWNGCLVYQSIDQGVNYSPVSDVLVTPVISGIATTVLAPATYPDRFDMANSVTVQLFYGEMSSRNKAAILNGANAVLLGNEILQFVTGTLVSANTYTLSGLLRGRLGTDWAMPSHAIGERCILLDTNSVKRIAQAISDLNISRLYKGVTIGNTLDNTPSQTFSNLGASIKCLSPVHVRGARDGSNNLTVTAIRRTRIGWQWVDNVDAPLGETSENYKMDVYSGMTVVRTITNTTLLFSYTAAQQTADGLTPGNPVHVKLYQKSGSTGAYGYAADATV
jgi:uncharacterized membrane protein YgcG